MEIQVCFRGDRSRPFSPEAATPITCMWVRQTSGLDHYAHAELLLERIDPPGQDCFYSWEVPESKVPFAYFDSILDGVKRALEAEGSPYDHFVSTRIRVIDGSHNDIDSKYMDYVVACFTGVRDYISKVAVTSA
jgi:hypothetical protein